MQGEFPGFDIRRRRRFHRVADSLSGHRIWRFSPSAGRAGDAAGAVRIVPIAVMWAGLARALEVDNAVARLCHRRGTGRDPDWLLRPAARCL